jgi:hypothetical protein
MKTSKMILAFSVFALGCSVKRGSVPNNPPDTQTHVETFGHKVTEGQFSSDMASALLWPLSWDEKAYEANINEINTASKKLNQTFIKNVTLKIRKKQAIWKDFVESSCIENYIVLDNKMTLEDARRGGPREWKRKKDWKLPTPVAPDQPGHSEYLELQAGYDKCWQNQQDRKAIDAEISEFQTSLADEKSEINVTKGMIAARLGLENLPMIEQNKNEFIFGEDGSVIVRLFNFNGSGVEQKSDETEKPELAIRDVKMVKNRLSFVVPGVGENAGIDFRFELERGHNVLSYENDGSVPETADEFGVRKSVDLAIFKGKLLKLKGGKVVQKGAAQFTGNLVHKTAIQK